MTSKPPALQNFALSNLSRIKMGEELVADATEWLDLVEEEFEDTILFAGDEAEARLLRPALARTLDDARADVLALEAKLTALRSANLVSGGE